MDEERQDSPLARPGFVAGMTALFKNLIGLLLCRLELAALELAEVRAALLKLAILFGLGMLTAAFALACWTALVIVLAWDSMGWKIIAIVAAVFTVATFLLAWVGRNMIAQGKLSLPATMAELRNDRDALL